ncbi:hypothetical protein 1 [Beihai picorna-like virus 51]|uniref:hypothetical protein 1 n=1 Tax=Beihai picorna-like virus 51 TaxID=1922596 RepID=UPI00090A6C44|nr:hypothetical protein 1 [Beihai picorna-like virus 51]APG78011.1 hypothetical protein 1 [Beihai picorna-like virus 51]
MKSLNGKTLLDGRRLGSGPSPSVLLARNDYYGSRDLGDATRSNCQNNNGILSGYLGDKSTRICTPSPPQKNEMLNATSFLGELPPPVYPPVGYSSTSNPQDYARSIMDRRMSFTVYKKCVHCVKKCRRCFVVPLVDKNGNVVNYFVEHYSRDGKILGATVGIGGVRKSSVDKIVQREKQLEQEAATILASLKHNYPEMFGESGSDDSPSEDDSIVHDLDDDSPVTELTIDPQLQRMHFEGSVITEPSDVGHLNSTLGSQMEQVQEKMKTSFTTPIVKQASRSLEQLILLVIGLQYDTSLEAIVLRCVQFLSAITEGGIVLTLKDTLMKYAQQAKIPDLLKGKTIKEAYEVEQSQPASPEMFSQQTMKIWETMKQGIFTKHLSYILGTVFAFSACKIKNVKFNHPIYEKVVEHASADEIDGMDLIDHAIKLYNWTATVGMACLESRSLEPLTINTSTLAKCHEKYYYWHKRFLDFKRDGTSTMEERQLMYVEVETIQKVLERFVKCQKEKFMTLQASSLFKEVLVLYNDVRDFVQKIDRVKVAKGYHLTGVPKCGKSTIVPMIQEQICLARGVEYREQDNAQINLMAPYQDELNNATQTITINETLPIKEHLAKSVENAYNTALALVDPVPYHPNRSNLEDKAKVTMTHISVVSTGNTPQPFINVAKTPGAWERRYTIIDMKVRAQFSDPFGRIDSSKTDGSNDYHLFDVYEIVYLDGERKIIYFTYNGKKSLGLNTFELFELIRQQCLRHFAEQDRLDKEHSQDKKKGCLVCNRLGFMCVCPDKDSLTMSSVTINAREAKSVLSYVSEDDICSGRTRVAGWTAKCDFGSHGLCKYCNRPEPVDVNNDPEMGLVTTAMSTMGSILWTSVLPWVNPFIKMRWIWSIDNNVAKVFHEELVEELSYWPEVVACSAMSLVPYSWERREDGSLTWFGRRKDNFLRMVAAEKQIFLPLSYLLRRAFCWGLLTFFTLMCFGATLEYYGFNPREYDKIVLKERTHSEWGWYYFFPQFSEFVFERREFYMEIGVFTERYLDWQQYYVDIYFFERLLGKLCIPWYFTFTKFVPVLETGIYVWWLMPIIAGLFVTVVMFLFMWWRRAVGFQARYEELKLRSMSDPHFQTTIYERARRHSSEYNSIVPTAVGVIGAIVTGFVIWNTIRTPEMNFNEDKRTSWNDWFTFNRSVAEPHETRNCSSDEQQNNVAKVLTHVEATLNGRLRTIHGIYLEPGIILLSRHFFKLNPFKEEMVEYLDLFMETNGVKHKCRAYSKNLVRIANKDAVLLEVPRAPKIGYSCKNILPRKTGDGFIKAQILFLKKLNGTNDVLKKNYEPGKEPLSAKYEDNIDCAGFSCGRGLSYTSGSTRVGFCGSVLVADRRDGAILGFHIAGRSNDWTTRKGYAQEILYQDYEEALIKLRSLPHSRNTPEMRTLCTTRLGMNLVPNKGPHPKTQMFEPGELDDFPCIEVVGHDLNLPRYRSRVRRSLLSPLLEKHCNQPCRWRAPNFREPWKHHNKNLKRIARGAWEVPPDSLRWARDDYWSQISVPLQDHISKHPELCRELSLDEAINGVPNSWFMKKFKMDTSAGIPNGSKLNSGLFIELDPYPDGRTRYKLSDEAQSYLDHMLSCFDEGVGFGIFVRTCLKDEVVAEDSEKVRIFYILECLFGLACRMYYLPVAEFISRHPLQTECMVGVNCAGPEWEQLVSHINELATDGKLNDWDFSGYDVCRSPDVMCTSLNIQKSIGEHMSYSCKSLKRMEAIGEELRCPMVNWNGTIMFLYMWCSGNTMTVYGNSIENSLHQRISFHWNGVRLLGDAFYELGSYQSNEHIATYGDDGHAGSRPEVREITKFSSRKAYFDFIGMGFTNARKDAVADEVVDSWMVDFLKRRSVYHETLKCRVGALAEDSIWKMGHMSHGTGDPEDLALASIQTMLHEAFLHGETFYEWLRSRLKICAEESKIWTKELDVPYRDKCQLWIDKYCQ